jgi:hypothetical protein
MSSLIVRFLFLFSCWCSIIYAGKYHVLQHISRLVQEKNHHTIISTYPHLRRFQHILVPAIKKFSHIPGFTQTLAQLIIAHTSPHATALGYLYEIETALIITQENMGKPIKDKERVLFFNQNIASPLTNENRQFDVGTSHRFIECKTTNWRKSKKYNAQFLSQLTIVQHINEHQEIPYTYHVQSKHPIPPSQKAWFNQNDITFDSDTNEPKE